MFVFMGSPCGNLVHPTLFIITIYFGAVTEGLCIRAEVKNFFRIEKRREKKEVGFVLFWQV